MGYHGILECGSWNAEKELAECLNFIFSAFRIPNSTFNSYYGVDSAVCSAWVW